MVVWGFSYIVWVTVFFVALLILITFAVLRICKPGLFGLDSSREVHEILAIPATILANRVNDDDVSTLTSSDTETGINHFVSTQSEQHPQQPATSGHSRVESPYYNDGNLYTADSRMTHPPITSREERSFYDNRSGARMVGHSTMPPYHEQHSSPRRGRRSTRRRTNGIERSLSPHNAGYRSEIGLSPSRMENNIDSRDMPDSFNVDGASVSPSRNRSSGRRRPYAMAGNVMPLGVINMNPLAPILLVRHNRSGEVRLSSATPQNETHVQGHFFSRDRLASVEDTRGSAQSRSWQRNRHNNVLRGPNPHQNDDALIVVDGYCCDEYGNEIPVEEMNTPYGRAHYIARVPEATAVAEPRADHCDGTK
ncbi:unspecified product [Leishmania tarentolae]|uniref:Unspecified product n=1 Tax=Leishmania tarentolae TaxID=5689 RepID=A0A640KPA6_LEITA|nr:unspecified product [Leishmania tarentolae]